VHIACHSRVACKLLQVCWACPKNHYTFFKLFRCTFRFLYTPEAFQQVQVIIGVWAKNEIACWGCNLKLETLAVACRPKFSLREFWCDSGDFPAKVWKLLIRYTCLLFWHFPGPFTQTVSFSSRESFGLTGKREVAVWMAAMKSECGAQME